MVIIASLFLKEYYTLTPASLSQAEKIIKDNPQKRLDKIEAPTSNAKIKKHRLSNLPMLFKGKRTP